METERQPSNQSKRGEIGFVVMISIVAILALGYMGNRLVEHVRGKGAAKHQTDLNDLTSVLELMKNDYCLQGNLIDTANNEVAFPAGVNNVKIKEIKIGSAATGTTQLLVQGGKFHSLTIDEIRLVKYTATAAIPDDAYLNVKVSSVSNNQQLKVGTASSYLVMQLDGAATKKVINCLNAEQASLIEKPELVCPTLGNGWAWNPTASRCQFADPELGMCKEGYFVRGIKANGSLDCDKAPEPPYRFFNHWGCINPGQKTMNDSCVTTSAKDDCKPPKRPLDPRECFNIKCKKKSKGDTGTNECMNIPIIGDVWKYHRLCQFNGKETNFETCALIAQNITPDTAEKLDLLEWQPPKAICSGKPEVCVTQPKPWKFKCGPASPCGDMKCTAVQSCDKSGVCTLTSVNVAPLPTGSTCQNPKVR